MINASETGFIFDLDGVLTDTAEYHFRAWERLAHERGWRFTRADNERLRGITRMASLEIILGINGVTLPLSEKEALAARKNVYYLELIQQINPADLLPGALDLLHEAKARGIRIGLGSASKNARQVLGGLGILSLFEAVGDGYVVGRGKPEPDLFVWVAGKLGLFTSRCIVFEDARAGVEAGLRGQFAVVGLGLPDQVGMAHRVRPDLAGATVDEFLPLLEQVHPSSDA